MKSDSLQQSEQGDGAAVEAGWKRRLIGGMVLAWPLVGVGCVAVMIWALQQRLDMWQAWQFISLIYLIVFSAVAAGISSWYAGRLGVKGGGVAGVVRALLWGVAGLTLLWVWFPPTEQIVNWWIRQVTMFRFG